MSLARVAALTGLAVLSSSLAISAQITFLTSEPGRWRPWIFNAIPSARTERAATVAEVKAFEARLLELGEIIRRTPIASSPIGFAIGPHGYLAGYAALAPGQPPGRAVPLGGGYGMGAFPISEYPKAGRTVREENAETELLYFEINQIRPGIYPAWGPAEWGTADIDAFIEPDSGTGPVGLTRIGRVFVLKAHDRPLWVPMPLGDALAPVIAEFKTQWDNRRDLYTRDVDALAKSQTPQARAARKADLERMAAAIPNGAEVMAQALKDDAAIEEMERTRLAPDGPDAREVASAESAFRTAVAALDGLSPEARTAPACYDDEADGVTRRFRGKQGAPSTCRALVGTNWAYFDKTRPRSSPQVLMVNLFERCLEPESLKRTSPPGGCQVNRQIIETLDWDAVKAWMSK